LYVTFYKVIRRQTDGLDTIIIYMKEVGKALPLWDWGFHGGEDSSRGCSVV